MFPVADGTHTFQCPCCQEVLQMQVPATSKQDTNTDVYACRACGGRLYVSAGVSMTAIQPVLRLSCEHGCDTLLLFFTGIADSPYLGLYRSDITASGMSFSEYVSKELERLYGKYGVGQLIEH